MGAGNGHAVFQAHQLGEHFRARDNRDRCLLRGNDLRVGVLNSRGRDHHIRPLNLIFVMAFVHNAPELDQATSDVRGPEVGSGHLVTKVEQRPGETKKEAIERITKEVMAAFKGEK